MTDNASAPAVRASDAERERVVGRLRAAAGDGRIGIGELDERVAGALAARTREELERVAADLPAAPRAQGLMTHRPPTSRFALGVFGMFARKGDWVLPRSFSAVSLWGWGALDLTGARFTARETRVRAVSLWGGMKIVVPDDVRVDVRGLGLMGLFGRHASGEPDPATAAGDDDAPRVVITGLALFGAVVTKRRPPRP